MQTEPQAFLQYDFLKKSVQGVHAEKGRVFRRFIRVRLTFFLLQSQEAKKLTDRADSHSNPE